MPRVARQAPGGVIFHVINRGVGKMTLFDTPADYIAFERVLGDTLTRFPGVRLLAYCLMNNHWHLVLLPAEDGEMGRFMQRLTITHSRRWAEHRDRAGQGHVYQGRYKSFPVQDDGHFLTVARYVERNPLRAGLVRRAQDWDHSSLAVWLAGGTTDAARGAIRLATWPVRRSPDWTTRVNDPQTPAEEESLRRSIARGTPLGDPKWTAETVRRLGLENTVRPRGRPKKVAGRSA